MNEQSAKNKLAWEHRAYEFWTNSYGSPKDKANKIRKDPLGQLKKHKQYFENIEGKNIANLCGSNGRKAVPLALLGADVTVFDISEENKRYALELAKHANISIQYIVTDIYDINLSTYKNHFDLLYLEGGILHYFVDINRFMNILFSLLKEDGVLILSDFHPLKRCIEKVPNNQYQYKASYFDQELQDGEVSYKHYFNEQEQQEFPNVSVRSFTLSEIITSVLEAGFTLQKFEEHRGWENENIPWEFTILAYK